MTDLPREMRDLLRERAFIGVPAVERRTPSQDGSEKIVFAFSDGARVQSVLMPDGDRLTLCVSTQVGCGFACAFCYTGTMGLERNLSAGEIVGQVVGVARILGPGRRLTHVVYMGMGEPLANYQATVQSLRILTDPAGVAMSPRRITVSTVGLVGGIEKLAKENLRVHLAISLHATDNEIRDRIMPVNKGFAIEELLAACKRFPLPFRQRMTFEYVLLDGINDADRGRAAARAAAQGHSRQGQSDPVQRLGGLPTSAGRRCRASWPSRASCSSTASRPRFGGARARTSARPAASSARPCPRDRARNRRRLDARLPAQPGGVAGDRGAVRRPRASGRRPPTSAPRSTWSIRAR